MSRRAAAERAFLLELFSDYLTLEAGHSSNTVESYLRDLRRFVGWVDGRAASGPAQVTRKLLREFVFALKDLGLSASTIRRQVSAVRTYYGFLLAEGRVETDPSDRLEMPRRGRRLPDTLSVTDVEKLLAAPSADEPLAWRDRALLELAYGAGLRVSELCGLTVNHLRSGRRAGTRTGEGLQRAAGSDRARGDRRRFRLLATGTPRAGSRAREDRVLLNSRGEPLSRVGAWGIVKRCAESRRNPEAGHHPYAPALLRYPFARRGR